MKIIMHDWGGYPFPLELSRELARRGHDVRHIYFPPVSFGARNMGARPDDPAGLAIMAMEISGPYRKYDFVKRRSQEIEYGKRLAAHIEEWRPDAVISANTPLDVQARALAASHRAGARFVFWLQDIISLAMTSVLSAKYPGFGHGVGAVYRRLEARTLRGSDAVVCITADFIDVLKRWHVRPERCTVIENWAPKDDIRPLPKDNEWSRRHGLHDKKVLLYAGRLGLKQNPDLFLKLAQAYAGDPSVVLLLVGEGPGMDVLIEKKKQTGGLNMMTLPFQPYADLPNVLAAGDVLISNIEPDAGVYSVPSKVLSYLAAGRAVLLAIPSSNLISRIVERIGAGLVVSPDDPAELIAASRALLNDPQKLEKCAIQARNYAEQTFNIDTIADRFEKLLSGTPRADRSA